MTELPPLWPHQERGLRDVIWHLEAGVRKILFTSPTGGGKTRIFLEVIAYCLEKNVGVCVYTNRNLLREQISKVLNDWGMHHGVRAAGHASDLDQKVQICSVQSESNRVLGTKKKDPVWSHHNGGLVITDEIHLNQGAKLQALKDRHAKDGAQFLDITATPLDLREQYDVMVQAGVTSELRECGSLLFARHHAINEPDTAKVGTNSAGEYEIEPGIFRKIWLKSVVGSIIDNYRSLNPDRRPTIVFAPGVKESIWLAERFHEQGIRMAHIDGSSVWVDGGLQPGKESRQQVLDDVRQGRLAGVSNRFVLREGIDIPELYLGILATVFGSVTSYLQSVGRILRNHPSLPGHVCLADHGGNWWRHGSPNADRYWELGLRAAQLNAENNERMRDPKEPVPIICPRCKAVRASGIVCYNCGYACDIQGRREIIQHDGELREVSGQLLPPKNIKLEPDTEKIWASCYHRLKNSKKMRFNFRQVLGLFVKENGYWPPENLKLMPRRRGDWYYRLDELSHAEMY